MKQPRKHTALLFIALGIIALLLLVIDMATGDTYIPVSKVWAVLTGGECDEMTRNILLSIRFIRVIVAALIDSSQSRLRPVMMASLTTILGMIPLLPDAMFGSLAASIMGGLLFGTLITLLFIPILYALFFHIKKTDK